MALCKVPNQNHRIAPDYSVKKLLAYDGSEPNDFLCAVCKSSNHDCLEEIARFCFKLALEENRFSVAAAYFYVGTVAARKAGTIVVDSEHIAAAITSDTWDQAKRHYQAAWQKKTSELKCGQTCTA